MIAAVPAYFNVDYSDNRHSSSSTYYSLYRPVSSDNHDTSTADLNDLWQDEAFMQSVRQHKLEADRQAVRQRIHQLCSSFINNGGGTIGMVAGKVFIEIAAEIVALPFNEILAQYSPSNNLILFDLSFNKGIEVSIGKNPDMSGDENVMFSLSIDDEPYAINMKNIHELKNVLLETLSC